MEKVLRLFTCRGNSVKGGRAAVKSVQGLFESDDFLSEKTQDKC